MTDIPRQQVVLFVDDEPEWIASYVDELQACKITVRLECSIDLAEKSLQELENVDLLILDIMMPSGQIFSNDETEHGLRTGVKFYERVRKKASEFPIIVLTNVRDEKVKTQLAQDSFCWFLSKRETLPHELVDKVQSILKSKEGKQ